MGSGWQSYVAYINLGCYYLIGVPLGFLMGWFFHQGVMVRIFITQFCLCVKEIGFTSLYADSLLQPRHSLSGVTYLIDVSHVQEVHHSFNMYLLHDAFDYKRVSPLPVQYIFNTSTRDNLSPHTILYDCFPVTTIYTSHFCVCFWTDI